MKLVIRKFNNRSRTDVPLINGCAKLHKFSAAMASLFVFQLK